VFLSSPFASAITGTTLYVDNGYHAMGKALGDGDLDWVMKAGDVPREG
jgi:enoyl-[acyl-carrier-protein] reductase (NADH)